MFSGVNDNLGGCGVPIDMEEADVSTEEEAFEEVCLCPIFLGVWN
jgi:hypothetical protein